MRDYAFMKRYLALCLMVACAYSAAAIDKADLDARIRKIGSKLELLQSKPDKQIPADKLGKAKGIVLLDRTKAGFLFAYQGGAGVALVRDAKSGAWSAPAFYKANEASLGFQVGGQQSFVVILLMNTNVLSRLTNSKFDFGGEASGTAGDAAAKEEGTLAGDEKLMLVYSDTGGLYGGVAVKGGALTPDSDANTTYYNDFLSPRDILFDNKAKPSKIAQDLARKLDEYSKSK
jgi:SH3 domain-containing YSC84-like protein 1